MVFERNYHTTKYLSKKIISNRNKKMPKLMIKLVYLGLSILEINKAATYEFWYDYLKPKIRQKKIVLYGYRKTENRRYLWTEDISEGTAKDVD